MTNTWARLADPKPEVWLPDTTQVMRSLDWYGAEVWGYAYGNFWASYPCRIRSHHWTVLTQHHDGRQVRRCFRCGSQVHQHLTVPAPQRGRI